LLFLLLLYFVIVDDIVIDQLPDNHYPRCAVQ